MSTSTPHSISNFRIGSGQATSKVSKGEGGPLGRGDSQAVLSAGRAEICRGPVNAERLEGAAIRPTEVAKETGRRRS